MVHGCTNIADLAHFRGAQPDFSDHILHGGRGLWLSRGEGRQTCHHSPPYVLAKLGLRHIHLVFTKYELGFYVFFVTGFIYGIVL
jgi:hypothetical protein